MSRIAASLALVLVHPLVLVLGTAPASSSSLAVQEGPPSPSTPQSAYGSEAVRSTNAARTRHDLRALDVDNCLHRFAAQQATAMSRQESMYHQDLAPIMNTCGLNLVGENVAYGYPSGRDVVRGWLDSPGHRANILNRGFRVIAVAARAGADGRWYAAQVFGRR